MQKSMEVLFLGFWWLWCSYTIISWQNRTNGVNQLPRLSRRWVPGIPMGFHCGQPAPTDRILPPWLANPHNQATSPHFSHPSHWRSSRRKKNKGWEGGGGETWKQPLHRLPHKRSTKNSLQCTKLPHTMKNLPSLNVMWISQGWGGKAE